MIAKTDFSKDCSEDKEQIIRSASNLGEIIQSWIQIQIFFSASARDNSEQLTAGEWFFVRRCQGHNWPLNKL